MLVVELPPRCFETLALGGGPGVPPDAVRRAAFAGVWQGHRRGVDDLFLPYLLTEYTLGIVAVPRAALATAVALEPDDDAPVGLRASRGGELRFATAGADAPIAVTVARRVLAAA